MRDGLFFRPSKLPNLDAESLGRCQASHNI